jgi:DNA polymerase III delta prime subunit
MNIYSRKGGVRGTVGSLRCVKKDIKINDQKIEMISFSQILERTQIENEIKQFLTSFESQCSNVNFKKGIYIYGSPGCGKTHFVTNLLKEMDYDVIKYDAGDVRNRALIDTITSNNISNRNVLHMMSRKVKKIVIVMDEIDGMNNGDKGGINALIKLIRQKKTKKQRLENVTLNPIICIGNYYVDKKIKELIKVCNAYELKPPTLDQMSTLLDRIIGKEFKEIKPQILEYVQSDIRKLMFIENLYKKKPQLLNRDTLHTIFQTKSYNEDAKKITRSLIHHHVPIQDHNTFMNETDRTIVALLWHENIADTLLKIPPEKSIPFYIRILDNICYADYIDRITFQNQIWLFNEMSSMMKTFHNNKIFHDTFPNVKPESLPSEIRFTKVLTKYSTEYNNILFIYNMCQELDMDKKDLVSFFQEMRLFFNSEEKDFLQSSEGMAQMDLLFENYNITKLDIKRMYRYLDKNVKKESDTLIEDDDDDE